MAGLDGTSSLSSVTWLQRFVVPSVECQSELARRMAHLIADTRNEHEFAVVLIVDERMIVLRLAYDLFRLADENEDENETEHKQRENSSKKREWLLALICLDNSHLCRRLNCTQATSRVDGLRVDVWRIPCCKCSVVLRDVNVFGCIRSSCPRLSYAFIHLGFHEQFWCNESSAGWQHPMQTLHPPIDRHRVSLSRSLDFSSSRTVSNTPLAILLIRTTPRARRTATSMK